MKKSILIVEDDKKIVMALAIRLKASGYQVLAAHDAVMAIPMALKHCPDLVLLDISMPGGDGFMVAERIQRLTSLIGLPIIFITAIKKPGLRERAMDLGAVDFFEKPYEDKDLLAAIQKTLNECPAS